MADMPTHPRRPQPEPLKTNDVRVAAAGTVVWAVALLVLLVVGLPEDETWWLWVCVTGAVIGLFACWFVPRMQRTRVAEESSPAAGGTPAGEIEEAPLREETSAAREMRAAEERGEGTTRRPPLS